MAQDGSRAAGLSARAEAPATYDDDLVQVTVRHTGTVDSDGRRTRVRYSTTWAQEQKMSELGDRTVMEALADGYDAKVVWRAVWKVLELPARDR